MAARSSPGVGVFFRVSGVGFPGTRGRWRRWGFAAFAAASFAILALALVSGSAAAQGSDAGLFAFLFSGLPQGSSATHFVRLPIEDGRRASGEPLRRGGAQNTSISPRRAVCVRLCDGYFFPASPVAGLDAPPNFEASCANQCPDAPTSVFYQSGGNSPIEDAVSSSGERYSALAVALRYRATRDDNCACHRFTRYDSTALSDPTLRKGDALMTNQGVLVFIGAPGAVHSPDDFASLAAASLPSDERARLQTLQRFASAPQRGEPVSWIAMTPSSPPDPTEADASARRFSDAPVARTN